MSIGLPCCLVIACALLLFRLYKKCKDFKYLSVCLFLCVVGGTWWFNRKAESLYSPLIKVEVTYGQRTSFLFLVRAQNKKTKPNRKQKTEILSSSFAKLNETKRKENIFYWREFRPTAVLARCGAMDRSVDDDRRREGERQPADLGLCLKCLELNHAAPRRAFLLGE